MLKNYFTIFTFTYGILILTKFIFTTVLYNHFEEFDLQEIIYAVFWGYKFDFAVSAALAFLGTFFDFSKYLSSKLTSVLITTVFFLQIGDILYFDEASRHIAYEITDTLQDASSLLLTAYTQHLVLSVSALVFGLILLYLSGTFFQRLRSVALSKSYLLQKLLLVGLTIFFLRGMLQHIPLDPYQSNQIGNAKLATLSLNATYNVLYALANQKKKLQRVPLPVLSDEIIQNTMQELYPKQKNKVQNFPLVKTKPNVVFLFLESWSAAYLKPYGYQYETTPFFNQLLEKSLRPKMMIAGGHRTTEGMFTTLTSLQNPLGKTVANTHLQTFQFVSIINLLKEVGYTSAFFQGTSKETSGTGSFAQTLGFTHSFGKRDVTKRRYEENSWGVHDYDLYNFALSTVGSELKEPFVMGINGASTHDLMIPKAIKPIQFVDDENLNKKLNTFHFADFSLQHFIEATQKKYPNTIFVLFADHCGGGIEDSLKNYEIPFAIYAKDLLTPKYYDLVLSQRDIAPTLYDMMLGDYKTSKTPFSGKSLLQDKKFFADYYHNGVLGWVEKKRAIEFNVINKQLECFKLEEFEKVKQECGLKDKELQTRALSFTHLSQKLLFENKLDKFHSYRSDENDK